ncbi:MULTISPECIES: class I SAM-dependent methyltransferase [unclassified Thalassospira]|uniref:class I SAM-dependent methyltransferase n=1 Tax=unclassified Thalassospira TaxID=2648997 RepID=UPI001B267852|nr:MULTISPECIES: class I SAM-dependent methyltransferase [unclassified Thalassospira]MBO6806243.1 class I SAM-dependent methyltransferase [Thalassospira sp.]MBO6839235.1 class I SAM-dependent methyltransferase [Thalassospira sp.]|tara:strand:+ start:452 stop:1201 length:750 start_codon:yes stop_codon:yes gene_type:complete
MTSKEQMHFDLRASSYETDIGQDYPQALKWQLIEKYSQPGNTVVDVGGANGRHAVDLAGLRREVTCVDLSPSMLLQMRKRDEFRALPQKQRPRPVVSRAQQLPISSNSVDMSYCFATLLLMPDQEKAISELVRIVRPGGYVILDIARPWNLGWIYWRRHYKKHGFPGIYPLSFKRTNTLFRGLKCHLEEKVATGFLSQLLFLPRVESRTKLREFIHAAGQSPDLDGRITGKVPLLANREYIVLRKDNRL